MKKGKIIIISVIFGFVLGVIFVIYAMDQFGNPQLKSAFILDKSLSIEREGEIIYLPKGTTVQMTKNIDGQPYYSLNFVGWPDIQSTIIKVERWEYYFIQR